MINKNDVDRSICLFLQELFEKHIPYYKDIKITANFEDDAEQESIIVSTNLKVNTNESNGLLDYNSYTGVKTILYSYIGIIAISIYMKIDAETRTIGALMMQAMRESGLRPSGEPYGFRIQRVYDDLDINEPEQKRDGGKKLWKNVLTFSMLLSTIDKKI